MLTIGSQAPKFNLRALDGKQYALAEKLTLAIFFKTNCPTCQYAWQYYERLYRAYHAAGVAVWGISQHDAAKTRAYAKEYGATFPQLLDAGLQVSQDYDPEFVPTAFLIDEKGKIIDLLVSWHSAQLNEFSDKLAARLGVPPQVIVKPGDNAAPFKPG